jgi:hypothetical protein
MKDDNPVVEFSLPIGDGTEDVDTYRYLPKHDSDWWKAYRRTRISRGNPVKNYTHPNPPRISKFKRGQFIAWDGEGITDAEGVHKYTLLANSAGGKLRNTEGIGTREALDFLCTEGRKYQRAIHTIFAGGYDINMLLKDVPINALYSLQATGTCSFENFTIWYTPKKKFAVNRVNPHKTQYRNSHVVPRYSGGLVLWDSFGFSQSSFVVALENWLGRENVPELDTIIAMKKRRSTFQQEDQDEVESYNDLELQYIVKIMVKLRDALAEAGIVITKWHGAGAIAETVLAQHNVRHYIAPLPREVQDAAQYAYSGGRIEALCLGNSPPKKFIYRYDINSAYPSQMKNLPCLIHGEWVWHDGPPISDFSMVHLSWNLPARLFYPFFYRKRDGSISYPQTGEGWYWYPEYQLEQNIHIHESWSYVTDCDCRPMGWVEDMYKFRLELKARGSAAEKALKLGMNSFYGKFVQKAGYQRGRRIPGYHSLAYGGYITSSNRAQLYRAAIQHPTDVLMFATDAFYSTRKHNLPCSTALGEWDFARYDQITIAQAGVYWTLKDGIWGEKYRGFDAESLSRERVIKAWKTKTDYQATLTRFIGLGSALSSTKYWSKWRTWQTADRKLDIYPTGKRSSMGNFDYSRGLYPTQAAYNWTPDEISYKYTLPWGEVTDEWNYEALDGIPFRIIEEELEDLWAE